MTRLVSGLALLVSLVAAAGPITELDPGFLAGTGFSPNSWLTSENFVWSETLGFLPQWWPNASSENASVVEDYLYAAGDHVPRAFQLDYDSRYYGAFRGLTRDPLVLRFSESHLPIPGRLYFDGVFRLGTFYAGTSEEPPIDPDANIMVYLQAVGEDERTTNLFIVARGPDYQPKRFQRYWNGSYYRDAGYRITISCVDSIYQSGGSSPAFLVYIDNQPVGIDGNTLSEVNMRPEFLQYNKEGRLFLPLKGVGSFSEAAFAGTVDCGCLLASTSSPRTVALTWTPGTVTALKINNVPLSSETLATGVCTSEWDTILSWNIPIAWTGVADYVDGDTTFSCSDRDEVNLSDSLICKAYAVSKGVKYASYNAAFYDGIYYGGADSIRIIRDLTEPVYGDYKTFTIDFDGHSLNYNGDAICVSGSGNVTLRNVGTVTASGAAVNAYYGGKTTIEDGTYDGRIEIDRDSQITLLGGRFKADVNTNLATIATLPEGQSVCRQDATYLTVATPAAVCHGEYYVSLFAALAYNPSGGGTLYIVKPLMNTDVLPAGYKGGYLDLSGYSITDRLSVGSYLYVVDTVGGSHIGDIQILNFAEITIMGGTVDGTISRYPKGRLVIGGGRYNAAKNPDILSFAELPSGQTLVPDGDTGYLVLGPIPQDRAE